MYECCWCQEIKLPPTTTYVSKYVILGGSSSRIATPNVVKSVSTFEKNKRGTNKNNELVIRHVRISYVLFCFVLFWGSHRTGAKMEQFLSQVELKRERGGAWHVEESLVLWARLC